MHELAIAQSIIETVETRAIECNATHVKGVRLKIGAASGVVVDALTFSFEMLTSQVPILAGAQLLVDSLPHRAWCAHCEQEFPVTNYIVQCPICRQWSTSIVSGTELQIQEMEIETA